MERPEIAYYLNPELEEALSLDGVNPDTYGPSYGGESVALDLYNASEEPYIEDSGTYTKGKGLIPTGLHVRIPEGWGAFIFQRGSIRKTNWIHRAGVIDPGYSGEIFISTWCLVDEDADEDLSSLAPYEKTPFQLVFMPVNTNMRRVDLDVFEALHQDSKRQEGKIGSSDARGGA